MSVSDPVCCYCHRPGELRPYGPNGAPVCLDCAVATPARTAACAAEYLRQLQAAEVAAARIGCGVVKNSPIGPYPERFAT